MRKNLFGLIEIVSANLSNPIDSSPIRGKDNISLLNALCDRPKCAASEPCPDLCFLRMICQINWNKLFDESPPLFLKFACQVLIDTEICADEVFIKAILCIYAFLSEHNAVIAFHAVWTPSVKRTISIYRSRQIAEASTQNTSTHTIRQFAGSRYNEESTTAMGNQCLRI